MPKRAKESEEIVKSKKQKVAKKVDEDDDMEEEEEEEEVVMASKVGKKEKKAAKKAKKVVEEDDEEEEEEEAPKKAKKAKKAKKTKEYDEDDEEEEAPKSKKSGKKGKKAAEAGGEDADEESSGFVISKPQVTIGVKGAPASGGKFGGGKFGGGDSYGEGSKPAKTFEADSPMIYVNGFPYEYSEAEARELFKPYGEITEIYLPTFQDNPNKLRGFGFVTYSSPEEAKKALELNGTDLNGRSLRVEPKMQKEGGAGGRDAAGAKGGRYEEAKPLSGTPPEGCDTVFCGNLDFQIQDEDMHTFFKDCGEIKDIRWGEDKITKRFRGFGFVQFKNTAAVIAAGKLNGQKLKGRQIKIDYSAPRN